MGRTYLYGMVESTEEATLGIPGVDGISPVYLLSADGLGGVVSDYIGEEFRALPMEELVRRLLAHQQVVEHAMQTHTVLPVRFGTVLGGPDEVISLLAQGHRELVNALDLTRDKVEIEVAATWDVGQVLQSIGREEEVVRAREALASERELTVERKVRLGQMVKSLMDRRRDAYRQRMVEALRPLAVDVAANPLVAEEMVMNVAFLVERARQREFDQRVQELDDLFQKEICFRIIGPLPPYSFSTVEVKRLTREHIEEARRTLHLMGAASESEVRKAYRRMAAQWHRASPLGEKTSGEQMAKLRQASEAALAYCRNQTSSRGDGQDAWRERDPDCLFVIAIKGVGSKEVESAQFGGAVRV